MPTTALSVMAGFLKHGGVIRDVMSPSPRRVRTPYPRLERVVRSLRNGTRAVGFWAAVLLPAAYPVVLIASNWLSRPRILLVGLLGVHALALIVGRDYERRNTGG